MLKESLEPSCKALKRNPSYPVVKYYPRPPRVTAMYTKEQRRMACVRKDIKRRRTSRGRLNVRPTKENKLTVSNMLKDLRKL